MSNREPEPIMSDGIPTSMRAKCDNCGHTYHGGTVTVWLKRDEDGFTTEPRDDVRFLCTKGCREVHPMDVKILSRRDEPQ